MATTNGSFSAQEQYTATTGAPESNTANGKPTKDEIGWYFVEQYYTTLSKHPEKLHLFYGKRSQFVSGAEAEVNTIAVGRAQIQERIKELDFQDCKVRVSNVDSQGSDENIVIQVIGETSNKSAELKKFVQTFILTEQPSGYFVLNDIFRYIKEEEDEEAVEEAPAAEEPVEMPKQEEATPAEPLDVTVVDKKLEETIEAAPEPDEEAKVNGDAEPVEELKSTTAPAPEVIAEEVAAETSAEAEKPQDPVPTPAAPTRAASAVKIPAVPAGPPKPMSWANRAAAAAAASAPKPAVPAIPQAKAAAPATTQNRAPPAAAAAVSSDAKDDKDNQTPQSKSDGWQTAGTEAKRQNRPQAPAQAQEKEGTMGYIRNVTEAVTADELKTSISKFGEITYFDINRQKNCAFIEFKDAAGFQAAAKASPHTIGGEEITIEPRRPKTAGFNGQGFNNQRGGMGGRGRGGFNNRGRGAPRGRGGAAAPAAS